MIRDVERSRNGVCGLRRAFEEAGAESNLMTLWEVPTQEQRWVTGMIKFRVKNEGLHIIGDAPQHVHGNLEILFDGETYQFGANCACILGWNAFVTFPIW